MVKPAKTRIFSLNWDLKGLIAKSAKITHQLYDVSRQWNVFIKAIDLINQTANNYQAKKS